MTNLKIDWPAFIRFFNATMKRNDSIIPPLNYITRGKKAQVQRLIYEFQTKQALIDAVENMARSDLCNGRVRTPKYPNGLMGSFAWLTSSDDIFADVANGRYNNIPKAELTPEEKRQLELEQYKAREAERRAEARRIDEEESARRAAAREYAARHCVSYEEYQRMKKNGELS